LYYKVLCCQDQRRASFEHHFVSIGGQRLRD
jgi:hypothetical protein